MVSTNLLNEISTSGRRRWFRVKELPWSRAVTYSMLRAGVLQSILLTYPGCVKGLRLIDGDSLDRYLDGLAKKEFTPSPCEKEGTRVVQSSIGFRDENVCSRHGRHSQAACSADRALRHPVDSNRTSRHHGSPNRLNRLKQFVKAEFVIPSKGPHQVTSTLSTPSICFANDLLAVSIMGPSRPWSDR